MSSKLSFLYAEYTGELIWRGNCRSRACRRREIVAAGEQAKTMLDEIVNVRDGRLNDARVQLFGAARFAAAQDRARRLLLQATKTGKTLRIDSLKKSTIAKKPNAVQ